MKTDHWFYGLFQSAPDLITLLLPGAGAGPAAPSLAANGSANTLYRFDAPELKAVNHRLDGVPWPRYSETGTPEHPVVLLEVQMHGKAGFKHRLAAQSFRFLQLHPQCAAPRGGCSGAAPSTEAGPLPNASTTPGISRWRALAEPGRAWPAARA